MTSSDTSHRHSHHTVAGLAPAARRRVAALRGLLFLALAWAALAGALAQPALASETGPAQLQSSATPAAPTQPLRVFLPLTLIASPAGGEGVDLVDFTYRLQEGDDLTVLALEWGIDSEAIACVTRSGQELLSGLRPGQIIMIPNPRYRCHTVQPGETVQQIARDYGVAPEVLLAEPWNVVESVDALLETGQRLLILDGTRPDLAELRQGQPITGTAETPAQATPTPQGPAAWPYGDGHFIWPVQTGAISQGFRAGHRALDIAAPLGAPVYAADNGIVLKSGYSQDGYGGRVIIDHQIDYITLYAHLSQALVQAGDVVQKGQLIGYVGSTGNSTGPHVHFELRDFGFLIDPRTLLPAQMEGN